MRGFILPDGAPEWLEKSMNEICEKSQQQLRSTSDPSRAAGYFMAVQDLLDSFHQEATLQAAERKRRFEEMQKPYA